MSYTKKAWVSGQTPLSADNMNNIEEGVDSSIKAGLYVLSVTDEGVITVGNYQEWVDAKQPVFEGE